MDTIVKRLGETPQFRRDKFQFFLALATIAHLFTIITADLESDFKQEKIPLEIIFIKSKADHQTRDKAADIPTTSKKDIIEKLDKKVVEESWDNETTRHDSNFSSNVPGSNARKLKPTAKQLITRSLAEAANHTELLKEMNIRNDRPRRKYISSNTKDHRFASYMESWRAKVERVGNMNYPHEAIRKRLSGDLLLDVAIRHDGSVQQITIRRSAGHKVLDKAAINIVKLAAPFAPLSEEIAREVDILHITRTWKFVDDSGFTAR